MAKVIEYKDRDKAVKFALTKTKNIWRINSNRLDEDLTQEGLLGVLKHEQDYDPTKIGYNQFAFIYMVAMHSMSDYLRKVFHTHSNKPRRMHQVRVPTGWIDRVPSKDERSRYSWSELLDGLSDEDKQFLNDYYVRCMRQRDIAEGIGKSRSSTSRRLSRIRSKIEQEVE